MTTAAMLPAFRPAQLAPAHEQPGPEQLVPLGGKDRLGNSFARQLGGLTQLPRIRKDILRMTV
jgi:hypothetical protein